MNEEPSKGLLMVFTGDGKGKTTAALGVAVRAAGRGMRTHIIQFIKAPGSSGEHELVEGLRPLVTIETRGTGFLQPTDEVAMKEAREAAEGAWEQATVLLRQEGLDILVLDELTVALNHGLLEPAEVVDALFHRRADLHVIVTGRTAPKEICDMADLVTEMVARKHPYERGRPGQCGLDF